MKHTKDVVSLTDDELALIGSLKPAVSAMMRAFDADLVRAHQTSHTEYVALMFLSEAPEHTLQLSDLAARCQQSLSATSRAVGRLEAEGLIRREQSPSNARAYNAILTDAGLARFEEAWPTHVASIRRHLFDQLKGVDLHALAMVFQRIATAGGETPHIVTGPSRRR